MHKKIDLTNLGGLPMTQYTLDWLQTAYSNVFEAIAALVGDKVIVTGCQLIGTQVTNGWITYNGELLPLVGGALGTGDISIVETSEDRTFEDNNTHPTYFTKVAMFGSPAQLNFSELTNLGTLKNLKANLQQQIADLATALANHTHTWASITNKPMGYISYVGTAVIGEISGDKTVTVIIPNQGGVNYMVAGTALSQGSPAFDDDIGSIVVHSKTPTSFNITVGEFFGSNQNLGYEFAIIKTV